MKINQEKLQKLNNDFNLLTEKELYNKLYEIGSFSTIDIDKLEQSAYANGTITELYNNVEYLDLNFNDIIIHTDSNKNSKVKVALVYLVYDLDNNLITDETDYNEDDDHNFELYYVLHVD